MVGTLVVAMLTNTPIFSSTSMRINTTLPEGTLTQSELSFTETPTSQPSLSPHQVSIDRIQNRMSLYGMVQAYYLSGSYWDKLQSRIDAYGKARNILTLELHGNQYDMYDGRYSMTPGSFRSQIDYLMANDYHFSTMHEIEGFVYGWLPLPARSVILTTDLSHLSVPTLESIMDIFSELEAVYGYKPHMLGFIWTGDMQDLSTCAEDACWQALDNANQSGYFTFGSHSLTHHDFAQISEAEGLADLEISIQQIKDHLGIQSYSLAWPFETCSPYPASMAQIGITLAWGGSTKPIPQNFTAWQDAKPLCLPRLFPPNPLGISMRPEGFSLPQMLESALIAP